MNPKELLQNLEDLAERKGVTMAQVCKISGVAYSTYWRWTKGEGMQLRKLNDMRDALDSIPNK